MLNATRKCGAGKGILPGRLRLRETGAFRRDVGEALMPRRRRGSANDRDRECRRRNHKRRDRQPGRQVSAAALLQHACQYPDKQRPVGQVRLARHPACEEMRMADASTMSKIAARMYQRRGLACPDTFKVLARWRQKLSRSWRNAAVRRAPIREIDRRMSPLGLPPRRVLDEGSSEVFEARRWILQCGEDHSPLRSGKPKYRGAIEQRRLQAASNHGGDNVQELPQ